MAKNFLSEMLKLPKETCVYIITYSLKPNEAAPNLPL